MLVKILLTLMLAQTQTGPANGTIRGQILIPTTDISERILVVVQRSDGPIVGRVFSDSLGNYEVRSLPVGSYEVIVNLEGFEEARIQTAIGGNTFNTAIVNIPLREKEKFIVIKPDGGAADDIVDVTELSRKYPKKAVQDADKAREELRKGNDAKAVELLLGVIKIAPDFYSVHNTLGTVYQRTGRFRDAETEYRRARELNPRAPDPLVNLGSLFIDEAGSRVKEGKNVVGKILDDALDILEQAVKMKRSALAYYFLGTANYKSNFLEEAETNFKSALELDPRLPAGHLMLANLYIKQRKWTDALQQLDAYLDENPKAGDRTEIQETRNKVAERVR